MDDKEDIFYQPNNLEEFRSPEGTEWTLVCAGYWSETPYHTGFVEFRVARFKDTIWVLDKVSRNGCLDGVTEEDIEDGLLDDQLEALWDSTLEEAQNAEFSEIVMACEILSENPTSIDAGIYLYDQYCRDTGFSLEEITYP